MARVVGLAKKYDESATAPAPSITVRNAKLFLDGVIAAPAFTGAVSEPYLMNAGTADKPHWVPGNEPRAGRILRRLHSQPCLSNSVAPESILTCTLTGTARSMRPLMVSRR